MSYPLHAEAPPRDLATLSDDELMSRLEQGHVEASLAELQARHRGAIHRFVQRLVQDDHLAQDVTQETFERVFSKSHLYQPQQQFRAWLFEIARNQALGAVRSRRRSPRPFSCFAGETDAEHPRFEALPGRDDTRLPEERELMSAFREAVAALPERYQQAFRLCVEHGLQYREAAAQLGVPTGTVAIRLMRARKLLFGALSRHMDRLRRPPACLQSAV